MQLLLDVAAQIAHTLIRILPVTLGLALTFSVLSFISPCNAGPPWWRKRDIFTDLAYWFLIPVFARFARIGLTVLLAVYLLGLSDGNSIARYFDNGHGPIATLPLWVQCIGYLIVSDLFHYWAHRLFHRGWLWKYHAVHHAPVELEWITAARFHPFNLLADSVLIDVVLLTSGMSPNIFLYVGPFTVFTSGLVHANLNWTFGPLKYVFASPVFHRWHHTFPDEGGEKNFAGTFSLLDLMFGTFFMPEGKLPAKYGVEGNTALATLGLPVFGLFQRR
jgi:sterol desaturase/sphingolipid hydroxylase (fatty acid hydroxylase superfamily)